MKKFLLIISLTLISLIGCTGRNHVTHHHYGHLAHDSMGHWYCYYPYMGTTHYYMYETGGRPYVGSTPPSGGTWATVNAPDPKVDPITELANEAVPLNGDTPSDVGAVPFTESQGGNEFGGSSNDLTSDPIGGDPGGSGSNDGGNSSQDNSGSDPSGSGGSDPGSGSSGGDGGSSGSGDGGGGGGSD